MNATLFGTFPGVCSGLRRAVLLHVICGLVTVWGPHARAGDWPQWMGPARDGHAAADTPSIERLPQSLSPVWKCAIGPGFSSPVVQGDHLLYTDEQSGQEVAHLLDARTGRELWSRAYGESYGDEWGSGPRSTPFFDGDRVYVQSCKGEFRCLSRKDGRVLWKVSFATDFDVPFYGSRGRQGTAQRRGHNGSGIVAGPGVVVPVGSTKGATWVCFDRQTGRVLWKCGNDETAYSSPRVVTWSGQKQLVALSADALMGVALEDGKLLWRVPVRTVAKRHAASPVIWGNRVSINSHTIGLRCFEVVADTGGWQARPAWEAPRLRINLATPVLVNGHLYTHGANRDYVCIDAATGEVRWSQPGFGRDRQEWSATIAVKDSLLVLTHEGTLLLLKADPARYVERGRLQVCTATWAYPALAGTRLYIRDNRQLLCLDLATPQVEAASQ